MSMEPFSRLTATALPLMLDNIDTDIIIPSREMKTVGKTGLADGLFAGWRYAAVGSREIKPDFLMNRAPFNQAKVLITGNNIGCGSSREHAVWALHEYGFRAVIAPSFNPIFRNNCVRNGIVPAQLPVEAVQALADVALAGAGAAGSAFAEERSAPITVDLDAMRVSAAVAGSFAFVMEDDNRLMLRNGWDAIDLTLQYRDRIAAWRDADRAHRPWIYLEPQP